MRNARMALVIRNARSADIAAMHRIRLEVRENRLSDPASVSESAYRPFVASGCAWVAERDGQVAGFAAIDLRDGSVWALFIAEEAQGLGIGRTLHDRAIEEAARHGLSRVALSTSPGTRADRFYRACGWTALGMNERGEIRFEKLLETGR